MELPDKVRYLIEALRGGAETQVGPGGKVTGQQYGNAEARRPVMQKTGMMPTQMRGWQLYNQEQKANGQPTVSYEQWMQMQGG